MADEREPDDDTNPVELQRAFMMEAAKASVSPVVVNRFQVMQTGLLPGFVVLVLGGGGMAQMRSATDRNVISDKEPIVNVAGAFAINKDMAADLCVFLEDTFNLDADFKAERAKRYVAVLGRGEEDV